MRLSAASRGRHANARSGMRIGPSRVARTVLALLLAWGLPARMAAQGSQPLQKTDLIRLLASPLIGKGEVADLIRRNCLEFRPTDRDRADLRALGADEGVMARLEECGMQARPAARAPAPPASPAIAPRAVTPPPAVERDAAAGAPVPVVATGRDSLGTPGTDSGGPARSTATLSANPRRAETPVTAESARADAPLRAEPGAAVEIVVERDGMRVDGGSIRVEFGAPFSLTLTARDASGNVVPTASLIGRFQDRRGVLELLGVEPRALATVLTFKPVQVGSTDLLISLGPTAKVGVEVVRSDR